MKTNPKFLALFKKYLLFTGITTFLLFIAVGIAMIVKGYQSAEIQEYFPQILQFLVKKPLFWLVASVPFGLFMLFCFNRSRYQQKGVRGLLRGMGKSIVLPTITLVSFSLLLRAYTTSEMTDYQFNEAVLNSSAVAQKQYVHDGKFRSVHLFGTRNIAKATWAELTAANIEQLVLVPYASQKDYNTPKIRSSVFRVEGLSRRDSVILRVKQKADSLGMQVIIKPHIWIDDPSDGKWRGDLEMESEQEWKEWEDYYRRYILHYAALSEQLQTPIFCIGNEFHISTTKRVAFWKQLIKEVRQIYSGKLTYGANWDQEFSAITFWDQLDYIGIQAYYPLTDGDSPELAEIQAGWKKHLNAIEKVVKRYNKPVIFTELGYKSTVNAARMPWEWEDYTSDSFKKIAWSTQQKCYEAFFTTVWKKPWFKGAWLWQWRGESPEGVNPANRTFSVRKKPAYETVAKGFGK